MMSSLRPDVVSICTPPQGRAKLVEKLLSIHRPKILICEKPLEVSPEARKNLVACCLRHEVPLMVNYNRRYSKVYQCLRSSIQENKVGPLTGITILAPNRLWSIGSHALNLLFYLAGEYPQEWTCLPIPSLEEENEPACDFLCRFPSGAMGRVLTSGFKETLIFEVDILGTQGRMRVIDNGDSAYHYEFIESDEFMGYRVLGSENLLVEEGGKESTFINIVREAAEVANGHKEISSSGKDVQICESILDSLSYEFKSDSK
jgi:predicted dehydrogenase